MQTLSLAINVINACWLVFVVVWVVAAASTKRSVYRESRAQRLRYWILLVIACFLLIKGRRLPYPLGAHIILHTKATAWTGAVLCIVGLAFTIWAKATLGRSATWPGWL
jgi:protein-S-isoprenylcysteine O-methyltransferase Ste14